MLNRFETTGILKTDLARALSVVGPVARASGLRLDVRRDHPYGRYRMVAVTVPHHRSGDVLARARIRIEETAISARLIAQAIEDLPSGAVSVPVPWQATAEGFSAVESPRGELLYFIRVIARPHSALPHQVAVVSELARASAGYAGKYHCRLPIDQQEFQSFLLRM